MARWQQTFPNPDIAPPLNPSQRESMKQQTLAFLDRIRANGNNIPAWTPEPTAGLAKLTLARIELLPGLSPTAAYGQIAEELLDDLDARGKYPSGRYHAPAPKKRKW